MLTYYGHKKEIETFILIIFPMQENRGNKCMIDLFNNYACAISHARATKLWLDN